jgi:phospholipid/cholesterol/gamma-HCH transport system permease protein
MAQVEKPTSEVALKESRIHVTLAGAWHWKHKVPSFEAALAILRRSPHLPVVINAKGVTSADSTLPSFLLALHDWAQQEGREVDWSQVPAGSMALLDLARGTPMHEASDLPERRSFLAYTGEAALELMGELVDVAAFTGECVEGFMRTLVGRQKIRWQETWMLMQRVGVDALPIVSLISFLVGLIISFLGAVTLRRFGAEFAVAYLVGFGMLREMGAIMTGIIMSGRTGAAFAAEIASMKVNEELDALHTFGISANDYLALPRLFAMMCMMPLLTSFANVVGIFGGWLVAEFLMGVPGGVFFTEMNLVVDMTDLALGIFKGFVFGVLIAVSGCLRGLQAGSGASAVGQAATRAVVTSITLIIFFNAVIDWAAATLGF